MTTNSKRFFLLAFFALLVLIVVAVVAPLGWTLLYHRQHEETTAQATAKTRRLADDFAGELGALVAGRWPTDKQIRNLGNTYDVLVSRITKQRPRVRVSVETVATTRESFGGGVLRSCFHVEAVKVGDDRVQTSVTSAQDCSG
ncbi:hypothetical protein [Streptosporangium sp. NPDC049644]|uniref:hypothetical protein n=1 Tax=Streptosporangium sp. NPDC049644 TaxID=3155507 RepID=UPI00344204FA